MEPSTTCALPMLSGSLRLARRVRTAACAALPPEVAQGLKFYLVQQND